MRGPSFIFGVLGICIACFACGADPLHVDELPAAGGGGYEESAATGGTTSTAGAGGTLGTSNTQSAGTATRGPMASGGRPADWDACSSAYPRGALSCGGTMGTAGSSGSVTGDSGGSNGETETLGDVASMRLTWPGGADAGVELFDIIMAPDGSATCRAYDPYDNHWHLVNRTTTADPEVMALMSKPGAIQLLSTECTRNVTDRAPTVVTTFAEGREIAHAVVGPCATDILTALSKAMRRIGEACVASAPLHRDI